MIGLPTRVSGQLSKMSFQEVSAETPVKVKIFVDNHRCWLIWKFLVYLDLVISEVWPVNLKNGDLIGASPKPFEVKTELSSVLSYSQ